MINLSDLAGVGILTPLPASRRLTIVGVALLLAGVAVNDLLIARYLSADGNLSASSVFGIRIMRAALITTGLGLFWKRRAILLVLLLSLAALNLYALRTTVLSTSADGRIITLRRLRILRDLMQSEGHVGFVTDSNPLAGTAPNDSRERYYLTQFAVAPVVVETGPTRRVVIVNARARQSVAGFEVVRDLGQNLLLLRSASE